MLKRAGSSPPRHDVEAAHTGAVETHQAMGDPSEHRCWQKNSQLFQCQRYSAQCYSVSRLNSLSAGATPYTSTHSGKKEKTVSKCRGTFQSLKCQKDRTCPRQLTCRRGLKSLSYCASVKDSYLCCRFERSCAWGIITFLLFFYIPPVEQRGPLPPVLRIEEG